VLSGNSIYVAPTDQNEIRKIIDSLHPKKSLGHNQLSSRFIKKINDAIVNLISLIVNRSLSEGIALSAMKMAKVIPIYKSKDKEHFSNYHTMPSV